MYHGGIILNTVSSLIDGGWDSKNPEMIKKGISRGEELIKDNASRHNGKRLCKLSYFIGNGYMNLYSLNFSREKGWQQILENKKLQEAKNNFRHAIKYSNDSPVDLKKMIWTNYANCLDTLGRGMDALFAYEEVLKIDPTFSMAIANKAIAMVTFADASGIYREAIYNNAYKMLKSVQNKKDLISIGGRYAKYRIDAEIKKIEALMDEKTLSKDFSHNPYDLSQLSAFEKFYVEFCIKNGLFLNLHIHEDICEASITDPVFIRLLLPTNDKTTFFKLAKTINQIKEDYAIARLLLVQSQFKTNDLDNISQKTTFVNTQDSSMSNIYLGLLKSAFKEAYNILDKIARFVNEYFLLGIPPKNNIYITSKELWMDKISKKNWKLKLEVLESNNPSLYALYDMSLDLNPQTGYYTNLRTMRNKLVHEKLIIHGPEWNGKEDDYNISYEKMILRTIRLLKIVKSAIIYLINAVNIEERKKRQNAVLL